MNPNVETIQTIREWQEATFGIPTAERAFGRMCEECQELAEKIDGLTSIDTDAARQAVAHEVADVIICATAILTALGEPYGVEQKMAINRQRTWRRDGAGCGYHVEDATPATPTEFWLLTGETTHEDDLPNRVPSQP